MPDDMEWRREIRAMVQDTHDGVIKLSEQMTGERGVMQRLAELEEEVSHNRSFRWKILAICSAIMFVTSPIGGKMLKSIMETSASNSAHPITYKPAPSIAP